MRPHKILLQPPFLILIFLLTIPAMALAEMRPLRKIRPGIPPHEVLENVLRANDRTLPISEKEAQNTPARPPALTWLTDCEADIRDELVALPGQKVFTVRNLGYQLAAGSAAVDYGIRRLHTPVLVITGNTGNEAIRLFMEGYRDQEPEVRRELDHLHLALTPAEPPPQEPEQFREHWLNNVERNVDYQVQQAVERYRERVADGRLVVVGSVVDLDNAYGRGRGRLLIININGETDEGRLRESPHLTRIEPKTRAAAIGRQRKGKDDRGGDMKK